MGNASKNTPQKKAFNGILPTILEIEIAHILVRKANIHLKDLEKCYLLETEEQLARGLQSGALENATQAKKANFILVDPKERICAPENAQKSTSYIFWEKQDVDDDDFTSDKVVRSKMLT